MSAPAPLVLDRLSVRRGGRTIVRHLSAALEPGTATALTGPNGVGKSTLLRCLAGLIPVAEGDARLGPVSLAADRERFQEAVLYAGHLDAVKPALSVADNLGLWAALAGAPEGAGDRALERFGLGPMRDRPAAECSAGQRRRLGLARILVLDRPVWLMDEPTVSLDAASVALVAALVAEHTAAGGTALIATHADLGLADAATLALSYPAAPGADGRAAAEAADDPFLTGAW